ncbi:carboxypeptidase regulatory-like domain-containing protein [Streptomyces sp. NPDC005708]|uniref:carboxypeptidase regulatory-like domain-containing protein n=1 Tax=Streptomyces sp. NPDC005708 TaxID=3154564 RepID=UPI00340F66F7
MGSSKRWGPRRWDLFVRAAALIAVPLAVIGLEVPAQAATLTHHAQAGVTAGAAAPSSVPAERVCAAPKPGDYSCFALRRTDKRAPARLAADVMPPGFGPADLQSAYNLPASGGGGRTIAIVDAMDDPNAEADLAAYRDKYGLPPCTTVNGCFTKVSQRGGTDYPAPDQGWAGEISLDLDMVSAAAPDAKILLVEADNPNGDDLGAAVDEAVALGAKYVSNSYGTQYDEEESGEDPSETTTSDVHYNHPGVAIVASAGDSGYGVSYPAASQYVTSVGGTSLVKDSGNTRGWSESVWGGTGSGCSQYESKPAFQHDTGCANRSVADVSAVADPATGVAVYQTYGGTGWAVYGGTSASAPVIASTYAVAGSPAPGTYPNSYPYQHPAALNDVTAGSNGGCSPEYLCTAGTGYDGPTGLGSPNGVAAFTSGPHGVVSGTVTSTTGGPVAGATVLADGLSATTDSSGAYSLDVPTGTYTLTASGYGFASSVVNGVTVADGAKVSENFTLAPVPRHTVSGTVTDGSGHHWPLYAKITASGVPGGPVFTDPATGKFSLDLPQGHDYTLTVSAAYPGYEQTHKTVTVASSDQTVPFALSVDRVAETAPGYAVHHVGGTQTFDSTTASPSGWSVANAPGTSGGWSFNDPGHRGNLTGGTGGFAIVDSYLAGSSASQDSQLISPVYDLSKDATPQVEFDTDQLSRQPGTDQDMIDATTDGGQTWTNVWKGNLWGAAHHFNVPLAQYAGKSNVQLRFRYVAQSDFWWELDNIFVGNRSYDPVPGGLVAGTIADANTGAPVNGARVTSKSTPAESALTSATPTDPNLPDGFYWMFSSATGKHQFSAVKPYFATGTQPVDVAANGVAWHNFKLEAGRLTVNQSSIDIAVATGGKKSAKLIVRNDGSAPATLKLAEHPALLPQLSRGGAPLNRLAGTFSPLPMKALAARGGAGATSTTAARVPTGTRTTVAGTAWQTSADLPTALSSNVADFYDGRLYTGFGWAGFAVGDVSSLYSYNPATGAWFQLASATDPREAPAHGFIGGKLYVAGGWGGPSGVDRKLEIYNPRTDRWSVGADMPTAYAASGSAVLNDKLYTVGGCYALSCAGVTDVQVYDPHTDSWSKAAPYPEPVTWTSCGAIAGKLYCAGGISGDYSDHPIKHAYVYDPGTNSWSPIADLPNTTWGAAYSAADGQLLVSGGVISGGGLRPTLTNQTYAYSPAANAWTALPNANLTVYRGAGAAGFYVAGGLSSNQILAPSISNVSLLPGYNRNSSPTNVDWLSETPKSVTIAPGRSTTVTVTVNAGAPGIVTPGDYTAALSLSADTPYPVLSVPVTMHVGPAGDWGRIAGTVLGPDGHGHHVPLEGATVKIRFGAKSYTIATTQEGMYSLWLPISGRTATVLAAKSGFTSTTATARITDGLTTRHNFALKPVS